MLISFGIEAGITGAGVTAGTVGMAGDMAITAADPGWAHWPRVQSSEAQLRTAKRELQMPKPTASKGSSRMIQPQEHI